MSYQDDKEVNMFLRKFVETLPEGEPETARCDFKLGHAECAILNREVCERYGYYTHSKYTDVYSAQEAVRLTREMASKLSKAADVLEALLGKPEADVLKEAGLE